MLEKEIERRMVQTVKDRGGLCYKFVSPNNPGVPDKRKRMEQNQFLWDGLDLKRFEVIQIFPTRKRGMNGKRLGIILMRSRYPLDDPAPWCVEYGGGGKYFSTEDEAWEYLKKRFRRERCTVQTGDKPALKKDEPRKNPTVDKY